MSAVRDILQIDWRPTGNDPIEVVPRSDLITRIPPEAVGEHEQLRFHLVHLTTRGSGSHQVDFTDVALSRGRGFAIQPGQVHRWDVTSGLEATVILFREFPPDLAAPPAFGPRLIDLDNERWGPVQATLVAIDEESRIDRPAAIRRAALVALRDLLVIRLGLCDADPNETDAPAPLVAFRRDLETFLTASDSVARRAARLGYSPRTISRACLSVTGRTAKQLADERIALEARRLLARPGASAADVANQLGFSEPTNFAKFFRRVTGERPTDWLRALQPPPTRSHPVSTGV